MKLFKKPQTSAEFVDFDLDFIQSIQPQGGISFKHSKFISTGDGYEAALYIYKYARNIRMHWLSTLMNINGAVTILDVSTEDINTTKANINKSINEQNARFNTAKEQTERLDAQRKYKELTDLYTEISAMGDTVKIIQLRIFIPARTMLDVDTKAKEILKYLEANGYKAAICMNESKNDWMAMFSSYKELQQTPYKRYGQPMLSSTLAAGNPFHYQALEDPNGIYYGTSSSNGGGSILLDLFRITEMRTSYNFLAAGKMGSGKSTLLKFIAHDQVLRGNFVRVFDVADEFTKLCAYDGGTVLYLDGTEGIINALEIFRTDDNEKINYNRHLSKVSTIYRFLNPQADNYELLTVEELLRGLYVHHGLIPQNEEIRNEQLTGLPPERYPIWSDFLQYIRMQVNNLRSSFSIQDKEKLSRYEKIELVIANLVNGYGNIFDGHTSIPNIYDTQFVVYNIKNLKGMKPEIFDAQFFNAMSQIQDNCVVKGSRMKQLYEEGKVQWEDITRFELIIDESHRIINAKKVAGLEMVTTFAREMRKFFAGLGLASQSIRDYVPENSSAAGIDMMKTLFELTTYKFMLHQDSNSLDRIRNIFAGQFTESEITSIPKLKKGEMIMSISGDSNIQFKLDVKDELLDKFSGGA